jgi:hypothetical protein
MEFYTLEKLEFESNWLDCVDATYILYLDGSSRYNKLKEQITLNPPSKIVYIVHNPGYKKVNKPLQKQNSEEDIKYSHIIICEFALKENYKNILVLEDDFIFNTKLITPDINKNASLFLENNNVDHYFLGCAPFISVPASFNLINWKVLVGRCTHAMIHTTSGMKKLISSYRNKEIIRSIDIFMVNNNNCYMYYKPIINQLFNETENKITCWGSGNIINNIASILIKLVNLDKKDQPGFNYLYLFSKISLIIIITIVVLIIYAVYNFFKK